MKVIVIETPTANLASVIAAFRRLGSDVVLTRDARTVRAASRVVLPGVGTFAAGMQALRQAELDFVLQERVDRGRPCFGICLGLQLFGTQSAESPGTSGLGVIDAPVAELDASAVVPQIGWNRISANDGLVEPGWAYFANSYAFEDVPATWCPSWASHGGRNFVAAVQRDALLACQFHPELSGDFGLNLIKQWLQETSC